VQDLKETLRSKISASKKTAVLGIGSTFRGDDAAGVIAARQIERVLSGPIGAKRLAVFIGGTAPENTSSQIKRFRPDVIIMIDSCQMSAPAGEVRILDPQDIRGVSFSTHKMPLAVLAKYLESSLGCETVLIGIQPSSIAFASPVCAQVQRSINNICASLKEILAP
jgi:hydrogenase 3 maturation protease